MVKNSHKNYPTKGQTHDRSGKWRQAATASETVGVSPSHPKAARRSSNDKANGRAVAQDMIALHRCCQAWRARPLKTRGKLLSLGSCQLAHERPGLLRPSAADFSCQHAVSRGSGTQTSARAAPSLTGALTAGFPICTHWGHKSGVDGQLGPPKERQAIRDHLQPTSIVRSNRQVQIPDKEICRNPDPCFPAHPGGGALHRKSCLPNTPALGHAARWWPTRIEWSATPASARSEREGSQRR